MNKGSCAAVNYYVNYQQHTKCIGQSVCTEYSGLPSLEYCRLRQSFPTRNADVDQADLRQYRVIHFIQQSTPFFVHTWNAAGGRRFYV